MEKLTIKEAAEYIGKSTSWVRKKILNGELQAEKESFKYGERYEISKEELDNFEQMAKMKKESIDIVEVEEKVSKEKLLAELSNTINEKNKELIEDAVEDINSKLEAQEETIERQNEAIKKLTEEVQELRSEQNESWLDKVRSFFSS